MNQIVLCATGDVGILEIMIGNQTIKLMAIQMLGGKCVRCGNDDPRVIQFDHIHGQRGKHGKDDKRDQRGHHIALRIVQGKMPWGVIQLLCANCHQIKTYEELYGSQRNSEENQAEQAI